MDSNAKDVNAELPTPPNMSVVLLVVLALITLGIFVPIWFLMRRKYINSLGEEKLAVAVPIVAIVLLGIDLILPAPELVHNILMLAAGIIVLLLAFKVRTILEYHYKTSLSGVATVFLTAFYLQHKMNTLQQPSTEFTYPDL